MRRNQNTYNSDIQNQIMKKKYIFLSKALQDEENILKKYKEYFRCWILILLSVQFLLTSLQNVAITTKIIRIYDDQMYK